MSSGIRPVSGEGDPIGQAPSSVKHDSPKKSRETTNHGPQLHLVSGNWFRFIHRRTFSYQIIFQLYLSGDRGPTTSSKTMNETPTSSSWPSLFRSSSWMNRSHTQASGKGRPLTWRVFTASGPRLGRINHGWKKRPFLGMVGVVPTYDGNKVCVGFYLRKNFVEYRKTIQVDPAELHPDLWDTSSTVWDTTLARIASVSHQVVNADWSPDWRWNIAVQQISTTINHLPSLNNDICARATIMTTGERQPPADLPV